MHYFCASCKKKHPVGHIAADLRDIARQGVNEQIEKILNGLDYTDADYDAFRAIGNNLMKFVNTEEKCRGLFLFETRELRAAMGQSGHMSGDRILEGTISLNLAWLIDGYRAGGENSAFHADVREAGGDPAAETQDLEKLRLRFGGEVLFRQSLRVFYEKVGEELVLDHIVDETGEPFYDDQSKRMLGYLRACPHCGRYVSRAVGHGEEIVVALMGSPRAGKTSCLTAVASALSSGRYARMGLQMTPFEHDQAWNALQEEMEWYDKGYRVEKTKTDQRSVPAYSMLVQYFDQRRVLTFVDMPGEFWQSGQGLTAEFFSQYADLFPNLDCIWFFTSKTAVYGIDLGEEDRRREEWQRRLQAETADDAKIIRESSAARLAANLGQLRAHMQAVNGRKIPPMAVILTKMEAKLGGDDEKHREQFKLFPVNAGIAGADQKETGTVLKHRAGSGGKGRRILDEREWFDRANKVRNFLCLVDPGLVSAVEQNAPFRSYISMAAYGHAAAPRPDQNGEDEEDFPLEQSFQLDAGGTLQELSFDFEEEPDDIAEPTPPTPYRELFPLIWTLSIMGAVEVEHRCEWTWPDILRNVHTEEEYLVVPPVRYTWTERKPVKGEKQHQTDLRVASNDVQMNLMMVSAPGEKAAVEAVRRLKTSKFEHRR